MIPDEFQLKLVDLQNQINDLRAFSTKNEFSNGTLVTKEVSQLSGGYQSANFVTGVTGWRFDALGNLEAGSGYFRGDITGATGTFTGAITASSGSIGGWTISPTAIYLDGATDALSAGMASADYPFYAGAKYANRANATFKVTPAGVVYATGAVIDGTTTIGGRLASTLASAIDSAGEIITANLNTSAKTILGEFIFSGSGALAMNTDANNGLWLSPTGILGKKAGANTFTIGIDGAATFAGTLAAASGTFGTITAGTIDGCDIYANNFRFKRNTHILTLSNLDDGWTTSLSGSLSVTKYATNQLTLYIASTSNETSSIKTGAMNILIGGSSTVWLPMYNPSIEFWTKINVGTSETPSCKIRLGDIADDNGSFVGFWFVPYINGYVTVNTQGKNTGAGGTSFGDNTINGYDASKWHKYRITITKNTSTNFTAKYYIDDTLVQTSTMAEGWSGGIWMFGLTMTNNSTTITDTIEVSLSQVILQQAYS